MKKILFLLLILLTCFFIGCSSSPEQTASIPPSEEQYLIDTELTLSFNFGERQGTYTGTIKNNLPHGYGVFHTTNEENEAWTYSGEWENGHFSGYGITDYQGQTHMGYYKDDELEGNCAIFYDKGNVSLNKYKNGELVQAYNTKNSDIDSESEKEQDTIPSADFTTQYAPGTYIVGDTIPAGFYCLINESASGLAKAEINKDSSQKIDTFGLSMDTSTFYYFQVFDGEYLTIEDGYVFPWDGETTTPLSSYDNINSGMYFIGTDIPPGEYEITNTSDIRKASFNVYNAIPSSLDNIFVSAGYVEVNDFITLNEGECITVRNGTLRLIN